MSQVQNNRHRSPFLVAGTCALSIQAWSSHPAYSADIESVADPAAVYAGANQTFAKAVFWKPKDSPDSPIDITLAPLIVQEVTDDAHLDDFGRVWRNFWGTYKVDTTKPTVYTFSTQRKWAKPESQQPPRTYTDWYFTWRYPRSILFGLPIPEARGVRIMSGADGLPLIWQPLSSRSRAPAIFFVSAGLEKAAREQFGEPLSGRRYSLEKGLDDPNAAIVARTIEDSPVPMGPYVYLTAGEQAISTVICRCMPSQVSAFVETKYYDLRTPTQVQRKTGDGKSIDLTRGDDLPYFSDDPHDFMRWPDGY